MRLRISAHEERRNCHNLLANANSKPCRDHAIHTVTENKPNVTLSDHNTSVVDGLRKFLLHDKGLKTALHNILNLKGQDIIQRLLSLIKQAQASEATQKSRTLKDTARIMLGEGKKLTGSLTDLKKC